MAGPQGVGTVASVLSVTLGTHKHTKWKGSVFLCVCVFMYVATKEKHTVHKKIAAANKHRHTYTDVTHNELAVWPKSKAARKVHKTKIITVSLKVSENWQCIQKMYLH